MSLEKLQNIAGLDTAQGLVNCMDDESLYCSIVGMYVEQLKQNVPSLEQHKTENNWTEYGKVCHSIKGASASVGASIIQSKSAELEQAGKNQAAELITAMHQDYIEMLNQAIEQMAV